MKNLEVVKNNFLAQENIYSKYATKSKDAIRFEKILDDDIRTPFFRDIDRIIHALSYTRYLDKTQVYSSCLRNLITISKVITDCFAASSSHNPAIQ